MICLFSGIRDKSTTDVMKWLRHFGRHDVVRINYDDHSANYKVQLIDDDLTFYVGEVQVKLCDIEAVWYRKGKSWLCNLIQPSDFSDKSAFGEHLLRKINLENVTLAEYLHSLIESRIPAIGSAAHNTVNKLDVLRKAKAVGFNVPRLWVSNSRDTLSEVLKSHPDCVTKAISEGIYHFDYTRTRQGYFSYTERVEPGDFQSLPEQLSPSFLQEQIHKKFDLRVFYLCGRCYAMAILSQADPQTSVDFRKYNDEKPNRCVPYALSENTCRMLIELFEQIGLNTGSADLVVDMEDQVFFLEINPVGQFGMVSVPCNYFLEREVAIKLIELTRETAKRAIA